MTPAMYSFRLVCFVILSWSLSLKKIQFHKGYIFALDTNLSWYKQSDCGWHIILVAELYTTCPEERVLVATKFNVTFRPVRLCYVNTSTCFSKDAENLTTYGYVLWCSQIVCTCHYSLNTRIACYSVIEWSNFAVSVWSMAWQATTLSHFT